MDAIEKQDMADQPLTAWPGIGTAYDFVLPSYQWMIARYEAADTRIQNLQVFSATVMAGILSIRVSLNGANFGSSAFKVACLACALIVIGGTIARACGYIRLLSPEVLYLQWLHYSEVEFKKNAIYWAGKHCSDNARLVNLKGLIVTSMTVTFMIQILALVIWIMS